VNVCQRECVRVYVYVCVCVRVCVCTRARVSVLVCALKCARCAHVEA